MNQDNNTDETEEDRNRLIRVQLRLGDVEPLFRGDAAVVTNLPDDARFVRAYEDPNTMCYNLVFRSKMFDPVPEGEVIPAMQMEVAPLEQTERRISERFEAFTHDQGASSAYNR